MDINKLLRGVDCSCGRKHTCDIEFVYIEKNAIARLREVCIESRSVLIVADENTYSVAGEQSVAALEGKRIERVIFDGSVVLVPDEAAIDRVTRTLGDADTIVGIGSGVIQDLCKYVSHESGIPYVIVATAPSMDGYASDGAAMITGGMKVTYHAGLPRAIIADTAVLKDAPTSMIRAGYGDIIGKFSALNDWKLSRCINGEYFCDYVYKTTYGQISRTLELADGLRSRNEESVRALMEALVVIGIMMSFAGSSRPASGSEHHLSHFFEITGILTGSPYLPHGIDVAYSTVVTASLRERLLARQFPRRVIHPDRNALSARLQDIYHESAESCMALQDKIGSYTRDLSSIYTEKEAEIREILSEMPSSEEIKAMLSLADYDISKFYSLYGEDKISDALLYAKELKDRYTVLWLSYDLWGDDRLK